MRQNAFGPQKRHNVALAIIIHLTNKETEAQSSGEIKHVTEQEMVEIILDIALRDSTDDPFNYYTRQHYVAKLTKFGKRKFV